LTTKKRIEKDLSKTENGMLYQNLLFGFFVLHFLFWGPILVCRSKKMADYNLMMLVFWIFWSRLLDDQNDGFLAIF
jgi:hypothetical protein